MNRQLHRRRIQSHGSNCGDGTRRDGRSCHLRARRKASFWNDQGRGNRYRTRVRTEIDRNTTAPGRCEKRHGENTSSPSRNRTWRQNQTLDTARCETSTDLNHRRHLIETGCRNRRNREATDRLRPDGKGHRTFSGSKGDRGRWGRSAVVALQRDGSAPRPCRSGKRQEPRQWIASNLARRSNLKRLQRHLRGP